MSSPRMTRVPKGQKYGILLLILYVPVSCALIGGLAYHMRLPSPVSGSYPFFRVFWHYANPLNSDFISVHLPALSFSLLYLLFLVLSVNASKAIISIFHIRVFLLLLIVLITMTVVILSVLGPRYSGREGPMGLFLHVEVHLILLYLLTYLPVFRGLKHNRR